MQTTTIEVQEAGSVEIQTIPSDLPPAAAQPSTDKPPIQKPLTQIRPRGEGDPRFYAPNRDLAYIGPGLVRAALRVLEGNRKGEIAPWLARTIAKIQDKQMASMIMAIRKFFELARDPNIKDAAAAIDASEIQNAEVTSQIFMYSRLGYLLMGAIFAAIRDVSTPGVPNADLDALLREATENAEKLTQATPEQISLEQAGV